MDEEFFRRVRSLCYVVSGDDHLKEGILRSLLDALLAGKHQWGTDIQVSPPAPDTRSGGISPLPSAGVTRCDGCLPR